ncbi:uncharacterized protein RAG0_07451 [Rhynchosporium agropyri]|uniref:Uncharacterized protein n=1 Tax=Rhynchosporium agropyri TaxID=914238 RepID=A0A1E1KLL6_9HELO|nr:uncharacterized protein RAG0_07451 [Rhynchosporium agropyri]
MSNPGFTASLNTVAFAAYETQFGQPLYELRLEGISVLQFGILPEAVYREDCAWELSEIFVDIAEFKASVKDGTLLDPENIESRGLGLDARLCVLKQTVAKNGPPSPKLLRGSSIHAHAIYSLIWPLIVVGMSTDSDDLREWIVKRARDIGRTTGIHQALDLADVLEKREEIHVWENSLTI